MSITGLENSSVIVTGGGSGIGRAAARQFAQEGARLLLADINAESVKEVAEGIRSAGGTVVTVVGDLSDQSVVDEVVATAAESFGGIDVLINNAGIMGRIAATADVADAEWERIIRVNLTAPFLMTRAALPHMLAKGKGAIVNTSSEAGLRGSASGTGYTVTKHGLIGLTRSTAVMYRDGGIRTNAVAPGSIETPLPYEMDPKAQGPSVVIKYAGNVGRRATADEVASVIVFLASDAASNVNGAVLPVDNGWAAV